MAGPTCDNVTHPRVSAARRSWQWKRIPNTPDYAIPQKPILNRIEEYKYNFDINIIFFEDNCWVGGMILSIIVVVESKIFQWSNV